MKDLTCEKLILDCLLSYEEGTMPPEDSEEFRRHIEMCPPCLRFLSTYEATGKTLRMLKPRDIPPDLAKAVLSFVRSRRGKQE